MVSLALEQREESERVAARSAGDIDGILAAFEECGALGYHFGKTKAESALANHAHHFVQRLACQHSNLARIVRYRPADIGLHRSASSAVLNRILAAGPICNLR